MIARLQKLQLLQAALTERLQAGRVPSVADTLSRVATKLAGLQLGAPFTRLRAAVPGLPIGGEDGQDIGRTFAELRDDLTLLYAAQIQLASQALDSYDIFTTRKDRLAQSLNDLVTTTRTLLAQTAAGSRAAVSDSFHTLDQIDPQQSTIDVDLEEGICTLPVNAQSSMAYDGSRVTLARVDKPAGTAEPGAPFPVVFNPYRLDTWNATLPALGGEVTAIVNVTGADYTKGAGDEVALNAIRLTPVGPLTVAIDWSPDGFNFQPLTPAVHATISGRATFHFAPVTVGFLRFRMSHPNDRKEHAIRQLRLGVSRIELLQRGFTSSAQLFSRAYHFDEPVHTVVCDRDETLPYSTRIVAYLSQGPTGPWLPVGADPVRFDTRLWIETPIGLLTEEDPANPATFWESVINPAAQPLPNTGELIVGRDQVRIEAYPFDWRQKGERLHIPELLDWSQPLGPIRSGVFPSAGLLNAGADISAVGASGFTTAGNPVAIDVSQDSFLALAIVQDGGQFVLQPGYNYRMSVALWCPVATTLDGQKIGVINPVSRGGVENTEVAPISLFVNGEKRFQRTGAATSVNALSGAAYQATLPLLQGWNTLELLVQVPKDLVTGSGGVASQGIYVYMQPNVFGTNLEHNLGIRTVQAYADSWGRVSEFDLRYNTPPGRRRAWAWKTDVHSGIVLSALFNFDPTNSRNRTTVHPTYTTLDGVLAGYPMDLLLRYPAERQVYESVQGGAAVDPRALYFRADFFQDAGATAPPVLRSYRLTVN